MGPLPEVSPRMRKENEVLDFLQPVRAEPVEAFIVLGVLRLAQD